MVSSGVQRVSVCDARTNCSPLVCAAQLCSAVQLTSSCVLCCCSAFPSSCTSDSCSRCAAAAAAAAATSCSRSSAAATKRVCCSCASRSPSCKDRQRSACAARADGALGKVAAAAQASRHPVLTADALWQERRGGGERQTGKRTHNKEEGEWAYAAPAAQSPAASSARQAARSELHGRAAPYPGQRATLRPLHLPVHALAAVPPHVLRQMLLLPPAVHAARWLPCPVTAALHGKQQQRHHVRPQAPPHYQPAAPASGKSLARHGRGASGFAPPAFRAAGQTCCLCGQHGASTRSCTATALNPTCRSSTLALALVSA